MQRGPPEWIGKLLGVRLGTELRCPLVGPLPKLISDKLHALEEAERRRGEVATDPLPDPRADQIDMGPPSPSENNIEAQPEDLHHR